MSLCCLLVHSSPQLVGLGEVVRLPVPAMAVAVGQLAVARPQVAESLQKLLTRSSEPLLECVCVCVCVCGGGGGGGGGRDVPALVGGGLLQPSLLSI